MANKLDENLAIRASRALVEAIIEHERDDLGFQPPWVERLRDRFEAKLRGEPSTLQDNKVNESKRAT